MQYNLFLGCVIPARIPFIEQSARKVLQEMNIHPHDFTEASCCPDPTGLPAVDYTTWLSLGARNLSLLDSTDSAILSLCAGCVETLKTVNHILSSNPEKMAEINTILKKIDRQYTRSVDVKHVAQLLFEKLEELKTKVKKPLSGFKVAVHYGCHFLRPSEIIQWDDPFEPVTVDKIVTALGAQTMDYDKKMECCGGPLLKTDESIALEMLHLKLQSIKDAGANCIVVVCPACFVQFEFQQKAVNKKFATEFDFPIFYLTELIALAMGFDEKDLGMKYHAIKPQSFLRSIEFIAPN